MFATITHIPSLHKILSNTGPRVCDAEGMHDMPHKNVQPVELHGEQLVTGRLHRRTMLPNQLLNMAETHLLQLSKRYVHHVVLCIEQYRTNRATYSMELALQLFGSQGAWLHAGASWRTTC
jgi:hypothetical protein